MARICPALVLFAVSVFGCDRGETRPSETESHARVTRDWLSRADVLRELSSPEGRSEHRLLEIAQIAADRWYAESYPILRHTFLEVWTPRMHVLLARAFGRNREWRILGGLVDLLASARAEPLPAGSGCDMEDPGWDSVHYAYYEAVFQITGERFESLEALLGWFREHQSEVRRRVQEKVAIAQGED